MKRKFILLIVLSMFILCLKNYSVTFSLEELSKFYLGTPYDVKVVGNYAYCVGGGIFSIINISNSSNPQLSGIFVINGSAKNLSISGNYAFIDAGYSGLYILDISDPSNPTQTFQYEVADNETGRNIFADGNYAYFLVGRRTSTSGRLEILDVSDPANPTKIGECSTEAKELHVKENYAYVISGDLFSSKFYVIDVSSPASPVTYPSNSVSLGGTWTFHFHIDGNYAYAQAEHGLQIIDITDPMLMVKKAFITIGTSDDQSDVFAVGDIVYFLVESEGLFIVDTSNKDNPQILGNCDTQGLAKGVFTLGSYTYIADSGAGLRIIDVSNNLSPFEQGHIEGVGKPYHLFWRDNYLYVPDDEFGLKILDISNLTNPNIYAKLTFRDRVRRIDISGNYAYLSTDYDVNFDALYVVDISNPNTPLQVGKYTNHFGACDVKVIGDYAYLTDGFSSFAVLNISDPSNPTVIWEHDGEPYINSRNITIKDKYAYLNDFVYGMAVFDLLIPQTPVFTYGYKEDDWSEDIVSADKYVYLLYRNTLDIFEITSSETPKLINIIDLESYNNKVIYAEYPFVFIGDTSRTLKIFDVRDPLSPIQVGNFATSGNLISILYQNGYLFLGESNVGISIYSTSELFNISGTITSKDGTPLEGMIVSISGDTTGRVVTDSMGYYCFENILENSNCTITPGIGREDYKFTPSDREINNLSQNAIVNFIWKKRFKETLGDLIVYPNPWKKNTGVEEITFHNLTKNCRIQIYTISGELIFEEDINKLSYTWDLKNKNKKKISSGIYVYIVSNNLGHKRKGKIAIIK
ncbi:T9SS type A sorting domain-containing protein [Candidatus Dependentiae bacterium]|nr:T9SS type A sorting domain-containing protein [Candidatus Dependentiae bacterium]